MEERRERGREWVHQGQGVEERREGAREYGRDEGWTEEDEGERVQQRGM